MWLLKANQLKKQEDAATLAERKQSFQEDELLTLKKQQEANRHEIAMEKLQAAKEQADRDAKNEKLSLEERVRSNKASEEIKKMMLEAQKAHHLALTALKKQSVNSSLITDEAGNSKLINMDTGAVIKDLGNVGKPSATYEKTKQAEKSTVRGLNEAVANIDQLLGTKEKPGLLYEATGSGIGSLVDMSARAVGSATKGDIANAQIQPLADAVLKIIPRFEGPQSDKDTTSYKEAAGNLANPNIPNAIKIAAAKTLKKLFDDRKGQFLHKDFENETLKPNAPTAGGLPSQDAIAAEIARRRGGK